VPLDKLGTKIPAEFLEAGGVELGRGIENMEVIEKS
jgi:hypothetical protein